MVEVLIFLLIVFSLISLIGASAALIFMVYTLVVATKEFLERLNK